MVEGSGSGVVGWEEAARHGHDVQRARTRTKAAALRERGRAGRGGSGAGADFMRRAGGRIG